MARDPLRSRPSDEATFHDVPQRKGLLLPRLDRWAPGEPAHEGRERGTRPTPFEERGLPPTRSQRPDGTGLPLRKRPADLQTKLAGPHERDGRRQDRANLGSTSAGHARQGFRCHPAPSNCRNPTNPFFERAGGGFRFNERFLRRMHNFALDMGWLPWPVLAKKRWPKIRFKEKRAVTWAEHQSIIAGELNPERRAYYECCWHLGGAQSDVANLTAEDIDWQTKIVSFFRQKTGTPSIIRFGIELERVLRSLPQSGQLFPTIARSGRPIVRANSPAVATVWVSRGSRCTATVTHGPSVPRPAATLRDSHRRPWDTTARPSTALMLGTPR